MTTKTEILVVFNETTNPLRTMIRIVAAQIGGSYLDHVEPSIMWVSDDNLADEMVNLSQEISELVEQGFLSVKSVFLRQVEHVTVA